MSKDTSSDETDATIPAIPSQKDKEEGPGAAPSNQDPPETLVRPERAEVQENDPLVGTEFVGKYLIKQVLGRGGMGAVYLAEHQLMRRKVAIKVLLTRMLDDDSSRKRFEHEARIASQLSHPNAVTLFDFGVEAGLPYLVMEFVEGSTLKKLLKEEGALSVSRTVALLTQLEGALSQAHRMGIVHRDLKPDNIVLTRSDTGEEVPKILDFGISKAVQSSEEFATEDTGLTQTGMVVGTPRYLAPEQARGEKVDQRTDVYSLGIMTYEMLSGKAPFSEGTVLEVIAQHLHTEAPKLSDVAKDVPPKVTAIVASALAKDPADRPQTVAEYVSALREASLKSWRGLLLTGSLLLVALVLGLGFYFGERFRSAEPKEVVASSDKLENSPTLVEQASPPSEAPVQEQEQEQEQEAIDQAKLEVAEEKEKEVEAKLEVAEEKVVVEQEQQKIEQESTEEVNTKENEPEAIVEPSPEPVPQATTQEAEPKPTPIVQQQPEQTKAPQQSAIPSGYYIQLEKFDNKEKAKELVQKFSNSKFKAYYEQTEILGKKKYVVFVGRFGSMFSAMGEAKAVGKISGITSKVTTVKQK